MNKVNCFCCNNELAAEPSDNPMVITPVYDGLIFRSIGNYGSTVFDPMPTRVEGILQVVICDNCIKVKANRATKLHNIKRETTAKSVEFNPKE